ncbi:hypothetical protein YPPY66_1584, partial [Yersinia pestis PY-66]
MVSAATQA